MQRPFTRRQRETLDAAARRIVPHLFEGPGPHPDIVAAVEARLAAAPPHIGRDFAVALDVLGSRAGALVFSSVVQPFARLSAERQDALLRRWGASRVGIPKSVYQAVRRLVLAAAYALPDEQAAIGYRGPFHSRGAEVPWEGPLDGEPTDDEPVARRGATSAAPATMSDATSRALAATWNGGAPDRLVAEIVVIGSGAGGAVAAARLAEAGRDVILLEEGPLLSGTDFTERESEMTERLYADAGMRATDDLSVALLQGAVVGGGTTVNWLLMLRTPDHVFDEWAAHAGTVGMSAAEMRPVFEQVERDVHARVVPDDAHSPNNRLLLDGARALGWRAGAVMINARGCVRSGFCGMGCRYDARQGTLATYVPRAVAAGARLIPDARAERIEVVGRGNGSTATQRHAPSPLKRVTASILDPLTRRPTRSISIEAPVVVLAAGAIGTPALLQRSGFGGGGVGRFLRLHPTTAVFGLHDREVYAAAGIPQSAMCDEYLRRDGNGYGYWIECPPMHPMLAAVAGGGFGAEHRAMMLEFPRMASLIALVRDGADREMSNGSVQVDRGGRVRIRYRLGPADTRHTREAIDSTARLHLAAGAREVVTLHTEPYRIRSERDLAAMRSRPLAPNDVALFSAHANGTCRIGTDPRTSGATPDGERHGVRGLYICDGSLFPTSLGVNPQETIMALGLVMAERVKV